VKESLCGAYNFTVKDYEVYSVTYSGNYDNKAENKQQAKEGRKKKQK